MSAGLINQLESVQQSFTARIAGMEEMDYWERLASLGLYSQERRRERYQIIFIWKCAMGMVSGYDLTFDENPHSGKVGVSTSCR